MFTNAKQEAADASTGKAYKKSDKRIKRVVSNGLLAETRPRPSAGMSLFHDLRNGFIAASLIGAGLYGCYQYITADDTPPEPTCMSETDIAGNPDQYWDNLDIQPCDP